MRLNRVNIGALFLVMITMLSACVAGQSINMKYNSQEQISDTLYGPVGVNVNDDRPFIANGSKDPAYIGHYRAGFGNTWDVKTDGGIPLAKMVQDDLTNELRSLGFSVASFNDAGRKVKVSIVDWNFDTYINGKFWYDCSVSVLDQKNNILADSNVKDTVVIKGNVWVGAKYAFEKELPVIYQKIIREILRDNPKILSALKTGK